MKKFTRILVISSLVMMIISSAYSQDVFKIANVGIGKTNPAQKLDVLGNVQFSGALMPGSTAGTLGNILLSAGAGAAPTWLTNGATGTVLAISGGVPTWVSASSVANAWNLTGNSGVTYGSNFIGSVAGTDQGLMFKVNGIIAGRIEDANSSNGSYYNTGFGYQALNANTTGSVNTAFGLGALASNTILSGNIAIGDSALYSLNFGTAFNTGNVAIGNSALANMQPTSTLTGFYNTAVGEWALRDNTNGPYNTAVGWSALYSNTTGNWNTAIGMQALWSDISGLQNTALGMQTLYSNNSGQRNTATGVNALWHNTTGSYNTAAGFNALFSNSGTASTGWYNTVMGYDALFYTATGASLTAVGSLAGYNNTGSRNVFIGDSSGYNNTSGTNNTFLGYGANAGSGTLTNATAIGSGAVAAVNNEVVISNTGYIDANNNNVYFGNSNPSNGLANAGNTDAGSQNVGIGNAALATAGSTSNANVAIGSFTLTKNTGSNNISGNNGSVAIGGYTMKSSTGNPNEGVGYQASYSLTSGINNASFGYLSDWSNTTGSQNVAIGDSALYSNTISGATALGTSALRSNSGAYNVAVGRSALQNNTSATANSALGYDALYNNTTASENTALGYQALYDNQNGIDNVAVGYQALYTNNTGGSGQGWYNVAAGVQTMLDNTTGQWNAAFGTGALMDNQSGSYNVALGSAALSGNPSGSYNIGIGQNALNNGSSSQNIGIGFHVAAQNALSGSDNDIIGYIAEWNLLSGSDNDIMGYEAMYNNSTGSNNVAIGYQAGYTSTTANANTSGSNNVFIGYNSGPGTPTQLSNAIAIGANATALTGNSVTLGNSSVSSLYLPGYTTTGELFYTSANTGLVSALAPGSTGQVLTISGGVPTWSSAGGSGTVTSFSAGNLSPLFTTSVATATTTPALSFTLSNAGAETILGNNTAIGATPTYFSPALASDLFANQGTVTTVLHGNAAGNPSWGAVNLATDITGTLSAGNGGTGLSTVGSNGQVLTVVSGAPAWATISGTNGGVIYGTGSGISSSGAGVAGQVLESTGAGAPIWVNVSTLDTIVGDNWGTQYAYTDSISSAATENTITGTGLGTNPLRLASQHAANGQVLTWNSSANTWQPGTPAGTGWQITGNTGITTPTAPATYGTSTITSGQNWDGTSDANDLVLGTNNIERMRIGGGNVATAGNVGVGTATPQNKLDISGSEAVGSYAGTNAAPSNGLIVSGQVGVGTNSPNASAALDVTSSTQGILIPRLTSNPASPAQGLMYFNSTTGCFMFYNGTGWQAMVCGCPNTPANPGTITSSTGSGTFCPSATGVTYSVSPVSVATGYTWTVPTGATITAGQGSTTITVTEGTVAGNVTVSATNNCGTGTASTLAVTPATATAITTQPSSTAGTTGSGSVTFTVVATGTSLAYQWMVNTGSGYSNVTNGAPYSGATTATLTITSPTSGMNGYLYECVVTGFCGAVTSNPATLSVCASPSIQIALKNTGAATTASGLQVMIGNLNFSTFTGIAANLSNIEFTTGPDGTGTALYAWIESGNTPTSTTSTETAPTTASTAAVVWVNLGTTTIAAGATIDIYMSLVAGAINGTTGFTGIAPQWTGTYGANDNGLLVFPSFYDNFAGTTLATKWSTTTNTTITVNNGLTLVKTSGNWFGIYTNTFSAALNNISESYCKASSTSGQGICINTSGTNGNGINTGTDGVDAQLDNQYGFGGNGSCTSAPGTNAQLATASPVANTFYVFSFFMLTTPVDQISYGLFNSLTCTNGSGASGPISATSEVGLGTAQSITGTFQWFRIRTYPPGGVMPTATAAYGCY